VLDTAARIKERSTPHGGSSDTFVLRMLA
jgi:hypothetical protein